MTDLKNCPFCGGNPRTKMRFIQMGEGHDVAVFDVQCIECGVGRSVRLQLDKHDSFIDVMASMDKVIEVWNRRAE